MSALRPLAGTAEIVPNQAMTDSSTRPALAQIRAGLEGLRNGLMDLSRQMERPILEVGAFLESIQDLESARPSSSQGSRLVVALQSYDMFHQEIQLAEHLISLLTVAIDESLEPPTRGLPAPATLANAESACFHLDSARKLIENAASEIPPAISQVLQGAGASPRKFENWGINRSLTEIGALTTQLGTATDRVEVLRQDLAVSLGEDPDERYLPVATETDFEDSSVTLF